MAVTWPLTNQWTDGYLLTAVDLQARITDPLNELYSIAATKRYAERFTYSTTAAGQTVYNLAGYTVASADNDYATQALPTQMNLTTGVWTAPDDGWYSFFLYGAYATAPSGGTQRAYLAGFNGDGSNPVSVDYLTTSSGYPAQLFHCAKFAKSATFSFKGLHGATNSRNAVGNLTIIKSTRP